MLCASCVTEHVTSVSPGRTGLQLRPSGSQDHQSVKRPLRQVLLLRLHRYMSWPVILYKVSVSSFAASHRRPSSPACSRHSAIDSVHSHVSSSLNLKLSTNIWFLEKVLTISSLLCWSLVNIHSCCKYKLLILWEFSFLHYFPALETFDSHTIFMNRFNGL